MNEGRNVDLPDARLGATAADGAGNEALAPFLICRSARCHCALPLKHVAETMRPVPVERIEGMPDFLLGVASIRGDVTPVVDMRRLIGVDIESKPTRFVSLRVDERPLALALDEVLGIRHLVRGTADRLPPLLGAMHDSAVSAISTLDDGLLLVLQCARLLSDEVRQQLAGARDLR